MSAKQWFCEYCDADFPTKGKRSAHQRWCPKNPTRKMPGITPPKQVTVAHSTTIEEYGIVTLFFSAVEELHRARKRAMGDIAKIDQCLEELRSKALTPIPSAEAPKAITAQEDAETPIPEESQSHE